MKIVRFILLITIFFKLTLANEKIIIEKYHEIINTDNIQDIKKFNKNLIDLKDNLHDSNQLDDLLKQKLIFKIDKILFKISKFFDDTKTVSQQQQQQKLEPILIKNEKLNEITFIFDYLKNYNATEHGLIEKALTDLINLIRNTRLNILKIYIVIPTQLEETTKISSENIKILKYNHNDYKYWSIFNYLINLVKTKYIFFGDRYAIPKTFIENNNTDYSVNYFIKSFLTLSEILKSNEKANAIVSGSIRNSNFEVTSICAESTMKYYGLKYELKNIDDSTVQYYNCDYIYKGNFLTSKYHLITIFNELTYFDSNDLFFNNLYLQFKLKFYKILLCPTILIDIATRKTYMKNEILSQNSEDFLLLMQKHEIELISIYDEKKSLLFKYKIDDCKSLKLNCKKNSLSKFHALPRCCRQILTSFMIRFENECKLNNVLYELDSGTLLGAVKFSSTLPWEIDGDLTYFSEHHERLKIVLESLYRKYGYYYGYEKKPVNGSNGAFNAYAEPYWIELYGMPKEHFKDSLDLNIGQTKINIDGHWVNCPVSPGLWVRNRYGLNLFKHALSWRFLGLQHSFESYSNQINNAYCPKVGFHSCMSALGNDGNYQYVDL
jgi:hypothetical protein